MKWRKDADMKYTSMCIYIDEHVKDIQNPGENPEIENTIYNYLWLTVKALAIKKCMFQDFKDYDGYSFYAANRLFFALRKNLTNQGKVIKGKFIRPIKSCLNYMKALMYPMKIEYQRETFQEVLSEDFTSKTFDAFAFKERLKDGIRTKEGVADTFWQYLESSLSNIGALVDKIMKKCAFVPQHEDYLHIKISVLLNCLNTINIRKKLDTPPQSLILWKLPKSMSSYIRMLLNELFLLIKQEIAECYKEAEIDDTVLEKLLAQPLAEATGATSYED